MIRTSLALALTFGIAASHALAWNDTGHKIVALLAYQSLDAATQKKIQDILKDHPHYDEFLAKNNPADKFDPEKVAMNAGTWSDWVRSHHKKQFHKGTWHYVNKPYIVLPEDDVDTRKAIEAFFNDPTKNHGDILKIIAESRKILQAPADTVEEKQNRAVRLCWLFHLVGDIHQPLHAVAMCNKQLPKGDLGGNLIWVIQKQGQAPKKLHALWDHMLGDHADVRGIVRDIKDNVRVCSDERKVTDPNAWADESVRLAKSNVYNFRGKAIGYVIETDVHGPTTAPVLPDGYRVLGEEIARQRVALAGARLADLLKSALAE